MSSQTTELRSQSAAAFLVLVDLGRAAFEHFPETQSLVCRSCADGGIVRRHNHMQDPLGVSMQINYFGATGVLPKTQLVFAEPM